MSLKQSNKKFKKAFTLVELIIVIAVIAILAVFLIPNFSNVIGDANVTNVKSDASNVKNIVMAYINETGAVPVVNSNDSNGAAGSAARLDIAVNGKNYRPGITLNNFQNTANDGVLYALDVDLLTKDQVNVEDKITNVKAKLPSIPGTSGLLDVKTKEDGAATGSVTTGKIKNTSVVYCIDKDLNVYAAYNKALKKGATSLPTGATWDVLNPSTTLEEKLAKTATDNHSVFKMSYISGVNVESGLSCDDSNYN